MGSPVAALHLATDERGNELLARDPLALLTGMLLDQQVPMEKAFSGPGVVAERLGVDRLDAGRLAALDEQELVEVFARPPAVHRYPAAMAARVQQMCAVLVERYGGDAAQLWEGATDGADLRRRLQALPGFGEQKARIFVALLGKQRGLDLPGWREAAGDYGQPGFRSVADVVDEASLLRVRAHKKEAKAAARAAG